MYNNQKIYTRICDYMEQFDKNTHNEIIKLINNCPVYNEAIGKYASFLQYPKDNIDQLYAVNVWANDIMSSYLPILNYHRHRHYRAITIIIIT